MIFSRNNLAKVTLEMFPVYYVCSHPTLSVLIFKVWASVTCSVNVSAHYFREQVEISFVGLTGALVWLRKASQSGKNCVRSREDTVLHRSVLITASLVLFDWSALGVYLYKTQLLQVVSSSDPATIIILKSSQLSAV